MSQNAKGVLRHELCLFVNRWPNSITMYRSQTRFPTRLPFPTSSCASATISQLFGSKAGRRQVRTMSTCRDSSPTCLRDLLSTQNVASCPQTRAKFSKARSKTRSATRSDCNLDSVIEFGLYIINSFHWSSILFN